MPALAFVRHLESGDSSFHLVLEDFPAAKLRPMVFQVPQGFWIFRVGDGERDE
jgi:hypothetical protein